MASATAAQPTRRRESPAIPSPASDDARRARARRRRGPLFPRRHRPRHRWAAAWAAWPDGSCAQLPCQTPTACRTSWHGPRGRSAGRPDQGARLRPYRSSVRIRGRRSDAHVRARSRRGRARTAARGAVPGPRRRPPCSPARPGGRDGPVPDMGGPADPGRPCAAGHRRPLHPPGGSARRRARGARRVRRHPHRVGEEPLLRAARPPGARRGSVGTRALALPDEGTRPGPGRRVPRPRRRGRPRGLHGHLRRRHARADPLHHPRGRARWSSPTRTCSTRRSCPTTPSGSSSSSSSRSSSSTSCHLYRGLFGSHVGNVLRRLLRICRHYGSNPVIVTCSATIANPGELATRLTGRAPLVVDRNGAPAGERHVLFVDPPVDRCAIGRARLRAHPRPALGPAVPAGRPPDDRLRAIADGRGADPDGPPRGAPASMAGPGHGSAAIAAATCPPSAARSRRACATGTSSAW